MSAISDRERAERFMLQTDVPSGHAWADRTKPDWNYIPVPVALAALLGEVREEAAGLCETMARRNDHYHDTNEDPERVALMSIAAAIRALSSKASS